ncbi:MAG: phosphatase PAP2 family protein [Terracidiphilus sp.]
MHTPEVWKDETHFLLDDPLRVVAFLRQRPGITFHNHRQAHGQSLADATRAYPYLLACLIFAALMIAASRIALGMHFLSDVAAGIVLGVALGAASFHVFALI